MLFHLNLARAFAIVLVTNSHLGEFYPWPLLASGGMVGNCLFFICSGWSIAYALDKAPVAFAPWIRKRLLRLYFPLLLWMCLLLAVSRYQLTSWTDLPGLLLWPVDYWFIPAIAIYYAPLYLLATKVSGRVAWAGVFALALSAYLADYFLNRDLGRWSIEDSIASKLPFYLLAICVGVALGRLRIQRRVPLSVAAVAGVGYLLLHYYIKSRGAFAWQLLVQLSGLLAAALFVGALTNWPAERFGRAARQVVDFLSNRAIYLYLAQVPLVTSDFYRIATFPANLVFVLLLILVLAELLYRADLPRLRQLLSGGRMSTP